MMSDKKNEAGKEPRKARPKTTVRPRPATSSARTRSAEIDDEQDGPDGVRLQKVLASAGVASRRKSEELIKAGRVKVDGIVVKEMGMRIDPDEAVVHVDGNRLVLRATGLPGTEQDAGHAFHHVRRAGPAEHRTTAGRPTERLFHVGRLDMESEGLLLLTNEQQYLAHRLTHPSSVLPDLHGGDSGTRAAGSGPPVAGGHGDWKSRPAKVDSFEVVDVHKTVAPWSRSFCTRGVSTSSGGCWMQSMHSVSRLVRTKIGELQLGHERPGTLRKLNPVEIAQLYKAVGL